MTKKIYRTTEEKMQLGKLMMERTIPVSQLAKESGVSESVLYASLSLYKDSIKGKGKRGKQLVVAKGKSATIDKDSVISQLERKLANTEEEATILQKLLMAVGRTL